MQELDPDLVSMWQGAKQAIESGNPDRIRHFTTSLRELFTHVLHMLSPEDEIRTWSSSPDDFDEKNRPKRDTRLRFIYRNINDESFHQFVKKEIAATLEFLDIFHRGTHKKIIHYNKSQLKSMMIKMEYVIKILIEIAKSSKYGE